MLDNDSSEKARTEDARWERHPVEGKGKPAEAAIKHKSEYMHLFSELVLEKQTFGAKVLEIAAGSCWASTMVKIKFPASELYATDVSVNALLKGRSVSETMGAPIEKLVVCQMQRLPFPDQYFDTVFGVAALHHADDIQKAVSEVFRVLKPGGVYLGLREGLASTPLKPLYHRLSHGLQEAETFGAVENVYTYPEWMRFFSQFDTKIVLKHSFRLGVARKEKAYYLVANLVPGPVLRRLAASIMIVAIKPGAS